MKILLVLVFLFIAITKCNTAVLIQNQKDTLSMSVYMDIYYLKSIDKFNDSINIAGFAANSKFVDEARLNIISFAFKYKTENVQSVFELQFGDMPFLLANADQNYVKYISKAYIGYDFYKSCNIQFGYIPDPVGSESSKPIDNLLTSVSICGYYEPDNFIGAKLNIPLAKNIAASIYGGNPFTLSKGKNKNLNAGFMIQYEIMEDFSFTYSNLVGDNATITDTIPQIQYYNNFVLDYSHSDNLRILTQFDYVYQKGVFLEKNRTESLTSGFISAKYKAFNNLSLSGRYEFFNDDSGFMTGNLIERHGLLMTPYWNGFGMNTTGFALGMEYNFVPNSYFKIEYRYLKARDNQNVFNDNHNNFTNYFIFNTGIRF